MLLLSRLLTTRYDDEHFFVTAIFPMISEMSPGRDINENEHLRTLTFASSNKNMFRIYFTRNNALSFIPYFCLVILFNLDA